MKVFNPNIHRNNKILKEQKERKEFLRNRKKDKKRKKKQTETRKFVELIQELYFKIDDKTKINKEKNLYIIKLLVKKE